MLGQNEKEGPKTLFGWLLVVCSLLRLITFATGRPSQRKERKTGKCDAAWLGNLSGKRLVRVGLELEVEIIGGGNRTDTLQTSVQCPEVARESAVVATIVGAGRIAVKETVRWLNLFVRQNQGSVKETQRNVTSCEQIRKICGIDICQRGIDVDITRARACDGLLSPQLVRTELIKKNRCDAADSEASAYHLSNCAEQDSGARNETFAGKVIPSNGVHID